MKQIKVVGCVVLFLLNFVEVLAQSEDTFTDIRDEKEYKTVTYTIKEKKRTFLVTWMAENLNFQTVESFCLNDSVTNCSKYGRLYTWHEAIKVCPTGWHLPSDQEWYQLADLYGGLETAGKHLRSKKSGVGKSLFNGLLAGTRDPTDGRYHKQGTAGFFWSSSESPDKPEEAYDWSFAGWSDQLRHWEGGKLIGNSCRCVKDDTN